MFNNGDSEISASHIIDFISSVVYSELITVEKNMPIIRPMVYVNDGLTIYMVSARGASKVKQIKENPNVSVVIIKSFNTEEDTKELIINGQAEIVTLEEERERVFELFHCRPDRFQEWRLSGDTSQYEVIRINPNKLKYFDYSTGDGSPKVLEL